MGQEVYYKWDYFYPRPPRGGRRFSLTSGTSLSDFYPRPPRGGRLPRTGLVVIVNEISTHALREEGDSGQRITGMQSQRFLPTPSARRATYTITK